MCPPVRRQRHGDPSGGSTRMRRRHWPVALLAVAAMLLAACGNSGDDKKPKANSTNTTTQGSTGASSNSSPGVTDKEIRYSSFGTDSQNPLGTCVLKCFDSGIKAYFAYRNSQGGIYGRKLVLSTEID